MHACAGSGPQAAATPPYKLLLHPLTSCCYTPLQAAATPSYRLLLHPLTSCCYTPLQAAALSVSRAISRARRSLLGLWLSQRRHSAAHAALDQAAPSLLERLGARGQGEAHSCRGALRHGFNCLGLQLDGCAARPPPQKPARLAQGRPPAPQRRRGGEERCLGAPGAGPRSPMPARLARCHLIRCRLIRCRLARCQARGGVGGGVAAARTVARRQRCATLSMLYPLPRCTASPGQLHRLTTPHPLPGDHANHLHGWDDLHPASPSRQIASIQLSGLSDYTAVGGRQPMRGVSPNAPCRVCFQPGKDVMVPGYPGVMDYPDDEGLPAFAYLFEVSE